MTRNRPRTDRDRRPRTVSISLGDRGQTTQDFAIGIGVFILAVAFVFSFLPTMLTPFDSSTSGGQTAQADRVADRIVADLASAAPSENPNEIDWSTFETEYKNGDDLEEKLGLRTTDQLNVTVQEFDGTDLEHDHVGNVYDGQPSASSARIVTVDTPPNSDDCDPACRLIVRIW